jgi:hypothetical protein
MGRQIQFHMLPDDEQMFLDYLRGRDPVVVVDRSADSSEVTPVSMEAGDSGTLVLWNKSLLDHLERQVVERSPGNHYYRVESSLPTLEYSRSRQVEWNGHRALLQGRVYGSFTQPKVEYENWYKSVTAWIRRHFMRGPFKLLDGYIGPAAFRWFQEGGILLPMFQPPPTSEWISFVDSQHPAASSTQT